jgi:hypothetical protein
MSTVPPTPARDLLAAVLEALDIPLPATVGDHRRYAEVLEQRASWARTALRAALRAGGGQDLARSAWFLRQQLAKHPPAGYNTGPWPGVPVDHVQQDREGDGR